MSAKATFPTSQPPRSMLLLRRAADAAGYAVAGAPDDDLPSRGVAGGVKDFLDGLHRLFDRALGRLMNGVSRA
jgi:hypothetical protein